MDTRISDIAVMTPAGNRTLHTQGRGNIRLKAQYKNKTKINKIKKNRRMLWKQKNGFY